MDVDKYHCINGIDYSVLASVKAKVENLKDQEPISQELDRWYLKHYVEWTGATFKNPNCFVRTSSFSLLSNLHSVYWLFHCISKVAVFQQCSIVMYTAYEVFYIQAKLLVIIL